MRLRLNWSPRADWDDWARHSEGCYILRTNVTDWKAEYVWRTYIQLSEAEAAFRYQKSDLSIRPVWHRVLLDELATIHSTDVVLILADNSGRDLRIRCVVRPDKHQAAL